MKYIKICLLLTFVVLISGCDVNYTLEINDLVFKENINIYVDTESPDEYSNFSLGVNEKYNVLMDDFVNNYTTTNITNDTVTGMNLTYAYSLSEFKKSKTLNSCFSEVTVEEDELFVYIDLNNFLCASYDYIDVDSLNLSISTNHKVYNTNGEKNKKTYSWNLSEADSVEFSFYKNQFNDNKANGGQIVLLIGFVILTGGLIFLKKTKRI